MGCSGCSTGRGTNNLPGGCNNNGGCDSGGCNQLNVFDWLSNMDNPSMVDKPSWVEVRFKNGRKNYFNNVDKLSLNIGDVVAVESSSGHDIGTISLTGELVRLQVSKKSVKINEILKIYRKARQNDIDKWQDAMRLEKPTMTQARKYAIELGLNMKICDVEYQGDKTKATFYYTAEQRVDFRELIKKYASTFKIRIEMRQIGARQEASRLGGVGSCGRELCCSSWLTDFRSVTTSAARYQQLSLNPQKLAGQCGKLKCCLNFELDSYLDAVNDFPDSNVNLRTEGEEYFHFKTDIFKGIFWYICKQDRMKFVSVPVGRVKEVQSLNKIGEFPEVLIEIIEELEAVKEIDYLNVVGQDDLTRFDKLNKKKKKRSTKRNNNKKTKQNSISIKEEGSVKSDHKKKRSISNRVQNTNLKNTTNAAKVGNSNRRKKSNSILKKEDKPKQGGGSSNKEL
jgi:cell fate regulator YaaT (PSP1 superfamily)